MIKFIFWAHSIDGLADDIEVMAGDYTEARNKVLKYIAMDKTDKHPIRGVKPSVWE